MKLTEKIAYMRGLFDGMQLDPNTKEGKAITYMAEVMSEVGDHIDKLESRVDELEELCDLLDEDLEAVEEDLYDEDDEDDSDDDDDWDDYDWDDDDDDDYPIGKVLPAEEPRFERGNEDGFDDFQYVVTCPSCKQDVSLTEYDLEEGSMDCPHCGELLEFDYDDIETGTPDDDTDGENGGDDSE